MRILAVSGHSAAARLLRQLPAASGSAAARACGAHQCCLLRVQARPERAYSRAHRARRITRSLEIVAFNSTFVPPMKYGRGHRRSWPRRSTSVPEVPTRSVTWTIARSISWFSRDALNAIYFGPDGIRGTADDHRRDSRARQQLRGGACESRLPERDGARRIHLLADTNPPTNDPPINGQFPQTVTFSGPAFSEPRLIGLAYAFEQVTHYRVPPSSTPPLASDSVGDR